MSYESAAEALAVLNATEPAPRRDACGARRFIGRNDGRGRSIHTWGDGKTWAMFVACRSP
jgi:hypothetical protein